MKTFITVAILASAVVACSPPSEKAPTLMERAQAGDAAARRELALSFSRGEYGAGIDARMAASWLVPAAAQGDVEAQFHLGMAYYFGKGVPQDDAVALKWFTNAAAGGNLFAQSGAAQMYLEGRGTPKDLDKAIALHTDAAGKGHLRSAYELSQIYITGRAGPTNITQAAKYLRQAAEAGDAASQANLAVGYANGRWGLNKDPYLAYKWYHTALKNNLKPPGLDPKDLEAALTTEQIQQARQEAEALRHPAYREQELAAQADARLAPADPKRQRPVQFMPLGNSRPISLLMPVEFAEPTTPETRAAQAREIERLNKQGGRYFQTAGFLTTDWNNPQGAPSIRWGTEAIRVGQQGRITEETWNAARRVAMSVDAVRRSQASALQSNQAASTSTNARAITGWTLPYADFSDPHVTVEFGSARDATIRIFTEGCIVTLHASNPSPERDPLARLKDMVHRIGVPASRTNPANP